PLQFREKQGRRSCEDFLFRTMAVFRTFLVQKCKIMLTLSFLERTLARVSFLKKEGNCKSPLLNYHNRKNILYQAVFSSSSTITDSASISATSIVPISSSTSFAFVPSLNIVKQYGQALEIIDGFTAIACSVRATLMRFPVVSSVHIKPPPAPQHIPFSFVRSISTSSIPGIACNISRGGSYTPLYRPK